MMSPDIRKFFLTVGFSGLVKKAPGTVGSFVALILGVLLLQYFLPSNIFLSSILITLIAVRQIDIYEQETNMHDSKEIVIDELVGMWIALSINGIPTSNYIMAFVTFIYFRIYDIWKPSIVGRIDRNVKGGWGVMGDDIVAGVLAGLSSALTYKLLQIFI